MKTIYSNCKGSHVIEDDRIIDSIKFKNPVESSLLLEREEAPEEEKLKEKYSDAVLIKEVEDFSRINKILEIFRDEDYYDVAVKLAKKKIKESVKFDNLLINASDLIEELTKTINMLSRRLREWFELYNPEFSRSVSDNVKFAKKIIENPEKKEHSMGADLEKKDLEPVINLARQILELDESRKSQEKYIEKVMNEECPNLTALAGSNLGAKLIALAGSFKKLSRMPSSTIQILGAEKALFRHIKTGAKSPKHGIILQHQLVANSKSKGIASRQLADKISIASKIDFFKGEFIGDKLLKELEKKMGDKR